MTKCPYNPVDLSLCWNFDCSHHFKQVATYTWIKTFSTSNSLIGKTAIRVRKYSIEEVYKRNTHNDFFFFFNLISMV